MKHKRKLGAGGQTSKEEGRRRGPDPVRGARVVGGGKGKGLLTYRDVTSEAGKHASLVRHEESGNWGGGVPGWETDARDFRQAGAGRGNGLCE